MEVIRCFVAPCPIHQGYGSTVTQLSAAGDKCNEAINGCQLQGNHMHFYCVKCEKKWAAVIVALPEIQHATAPHNVEDTYAIVERYEKAVARLPIPEKQVERSGAAKVIEPEKPAVPPNHEPTIETLDEFWQH